MPDQQEKTEPSDKEIFQAAVSDDSREPEQATEEPSSEQPRDAEGRFAPKVQADEPAAQQQTEQQPEPAPVDADKGIPSWRLREETEARRALESRLTEREREFFDLQRQLTDFQRQAAQAKPKPEPVNFFENPEEAVKQSLSPLESQFAELSSRLMLRASRAESISIHGKDAVAEMEQAVDQAMRSHHRDMPLLSAQMRASDDPVGVAMQWYQRDKLVKDTGGDLTAFKTKTLEDALKDPTFLAKAIEAAKVQAGGKTQPTNLVQLPPSLNRTPAAMSRQTDNDGDMSDDSLFRHATAR